MEIRPLKYFLAVADQLSFSAAVRRGEPRPLVRMFLEECLQVAGRVFQDA